MTTNTIRKKKPVNKVTRRGSVSKGKSGNYRKKTMKNRKMNMNQTKRGGSLNLRFKKGNLEKRKLAKKLTRGLGEETKKTGKYNEYKESKDTYNIESLNQYFKDNIFKGIEPFDLFPNVTSFTPAKNLERKGIIDYKEFLRRIFNIEQVTSGMLTKKTNDVLVINTDLVNFWSDKTKVFDINDDGSHNTLLKDYEDIEFKFDDTGTIIGLNMRDFQVFKNAYIQHIIAKILTHKKGKATTKDSFYDELRNIASASNVQYLAEILGNYYGKFYFSNQNENHLKYKNVLGLILKRYITKDIKKNVIKYKNHIAETKFSNELNRMLYYIFTIDTNNGVVDDVDNEIIEFLECFQKSADAAEYDNTENVFTHYKGKILNIGRCRTKAKFQENYENEYKVDKQTYVNARKQEVQDLNNKIAKILKTFYNKGTPLTLSNIKEALSIFSDDKTFLSIYPENQFNDYIRHPVNSTPEKFLKDVVEKTKDFFETVTDKNKGEEIREYVVMIRDNKIGTFTFKDSGGLVKKYINTELEKCTNEFLFEDKFFESFDSYIVTVDINTSYNEIGEKIDECTTILKKLYDVHNDANEMAEKFKDSNLKKNMEILIEYLIDKLVNFINNESISTRRVTRFTDKVNKMLTVENIDNLELQIKGDNKKISDIKNNELKIAIDETELDIALDNKFKSPSTAAPSTGSYGVTTISQTGPDLEFELSTSYSLTSVTDVTIGGTKYTVTKFDGNNKITIKIDNSMDKNLFTTFSGKFNTSVTDNYTPKPGLELTLTGT